MFCRVESLTWCTGLSKRNGAKLRELSLNFPKLADWLYIGWLSCLAALGWEFSNKGTFLLHDPVVWVIPLLSMQYKRKVLFEISRPSAAR